MRFPDCRLYLITPPAIPDLAAFGHTLAEALDAGDVAALQIRIKDAPDDIVVCRRRCAFAHRPGARRRGNPQRPTGSGGQARL